MRLLEFIDACYRMDLSVESWGELLCASGDGTLAPELVPFCHGYMLSTTGQLDVRWAAASPRMPSLGKQRLVASFYERVNAAAPHVVRELFGGRTPVVHLSHELGSEVQRLSGRLLGYHWVGLFANLSGAGGILFGAVANSKIRLSAKQREMLADACAHLAVAYQLRELKLATRLADRIAAALAPSTSARPAREQPGTPAASSELMIDAARSIDWGSFGRRRRSPKEACELWRAVKSSEYTLLETVDRGDQRTIVAVRRPGSAGLTPREAAVARLAAQGLSNKWIGGELGISASTVAVHLSSAMRKLGCPSRGALVLRYHEKSASV